MYTYKHICIYMYVILRHTVSKVSVCKVMQELYHQQDEKDPANLSVAADLPLLPFSTGPTAGKVLAHGPWG